jgi:hypothetical protein
VLIARPERDEFAAGGDRGDGDDWLNPWLALGPSLDGPALRLHDWRQLKSFSHS